jgi:NAD(P)-dependent dehydrogenase (short-subunit alcohol dehydrogenase family)
MTILQLDVRDDAAVARVEAEVRAKLERQEKELWAVVNNAGIFKCGYTEWGTLADYSAVFDVNVLGVVRVTRAFLPLLRACRGRVVNVADLEGRTASPGRGIYAMSKHAVVAFSTALRREMLPLGVKVSTIEPAIYKTPMADLAGLERGARVVWHNTAASVCAEYGQAFFESATETLVTHTKRGRDNPEEVVDAMMDAISNMEPQIQYKVCGLVDRLVWLESDLLPFSVTDDFPIWRAPKAKPVRVQN